MKADLERTRELIESVKDLMERNIISTPYHIKQFQEAIEEIDKFEEIMQRYIQVATYSLCFVGLKPEHKLYESIRKDLLSSLQSIKEDK
jgi:hypothetical protein